jgi:hypothetical protein
MTLADHRTRIRAIIFSITGFILALLFFRIILDILEVPSSNIIVNVLNVITDAFIDPFADTVQIPVGSVLNQINIDAIIAIGIYLLIGIALSEIITAFIYDNLEEIVQNFVDALFKIIEFLLLVRIIFDLFGVVNRVGLPPFIRSIYSLTEWAQGIVVPIDLGLMRINVSTIVILIFIVVLDVLAERFLASIFKQVKGGIQKTTTVVNQIHIPTPAIKIPRPSFPIRQRNSPAPQQPPQQQ